VDKRTFIKSVFLGTTGVFAAGFTSKLKVVKTKKKWNGIFVLPVLPYTYNALEPFMDAQTIELHYTRHHAAYTDKLNKAVKEAGLTGKTAYDLLKEVSKYPASIRNNCGGYLNYKLFWKMMAPASGKKPSEKLSTALTRDFGSFDTFKEKFSTVAKSVFGSGWTWLISDGDRLKITATFNQDSPIMDIAPDKGVPLLCLYVWEHGNYLKNQNRRAEHIDAFWNVVNWDFVSQRYNNSKKAETV
jgi:Fe-Mn family superoxide dismutase